MRAQHTSRLRRAWQQPVTCGGWVLTGRCLVGYGLFALIFGRRTGFLKLETLKAPRRRYVTLPLTLFMLPALGEEIVFRVLLVPHPTEPYTNARLLRTAGLSLTLFVVWHPLNGWVLSPDARDVLTDWRFLTLAAALGAVCTYAYRRTGSLWPPVLLHWLTVVLWMLLLGGGDRWQNSVQEQA